MASYINLNDEIIVAGALEEFTKTLLPITAFARNFSPEQARRGDQVLVPLISTLTATTFARYNVCGGQMSVVTINLTRHRVVQVGQTGIEYWANSSANLDAFARMAGRALAVGVLTDVLSLVTTANFGLATAIALSSFRITHALAARHALNQGNVPPNNRSLVLDIEASNFLLSDPAVLQAYSYGGPEVIRQGRLPQIVGFNAYEVNSMFPSGASVIAFAAHQDAIAIAMRYLAPQPGVQYVEARPVVDEETGLTFGIRRHGDPNTGEAFLNFECLFGVAVGISQAGRVIKRTD